MKTAYARWTLCLLAGFASSTLFAWLAGANLLHHERGPGLLLWFWGAALFSMLALICPAWTSGALVPTDTVVIAVTFFHPSSASSEIAGEMAWTPSNSWTVGDAPPMKSGNGLAGVYPTNACEFEFKAGGEVVAQIVEVTIRRLVDKADFVSRLIGSGGSVKLTIRFKDRSNCRLALSSAVVKNIAQLGLSTQIECLLSTSQSSHPGIGSFPL